jgi:hypothetical protein
MTYPTVFANLAAGNQPASLLDTMYSICGNQGLIACSPAGTNAIVLTPNSNFFSPAAYVNYQSVIFVCGATTTSSVTVQIAALAAKNVYKNNLVQAGASDLISGQTYILSFNSALNTGAGGFVIVNLPALPTLTFATLPAASAGTQAYIQDGLAINCGDGACTTFGTTVTGGGGALKLLVWYNGTNWTLIGK